MVDGDATGLDNAASVGLLSGNPHHPLRRHPGHRPAAPEATLAEPADLVVTDTNRKQGYEWNSLTEQHRVHRNGRPGPRHRPTRATPR